MKKLFVPSLSEEQKRELEEIGRRTAIPGVRTRAEMILLSAKKGFNSKEIADLVRENSVTVLRWLQRYIA